MNKAKASIFSTRNIVIIAAFAAIASILFWIPGIPLLVPFYKLDFSNIPVLIVTFALGPIQGLLTLLLKDVIGLLHTTSGGVGELADFLAGMAYILPAGILYQRRKTLKRAIVGMVLGTLLAIVVSILSNKFILFPFYGYPEEAIVNLGTKIFPFVTNMFSFLICVTGLFNLIKFAVVSTVTGLIYKPLSPILHDKKARKGA